MDTNQPEKQVDWKYIASLVVGGLMYILGLFTDVNQIINNFFNSTISGWFTFPILSVFCVLIGYTIILRWKGKFILLTKFHNIGKLSTQLVGVVLIICTIKLLIDFGKPEIMFLNRLVATLLLLFCAFFVTLISGLMLQSRKIEEDHDCPMHFEVDKLKQSQAFSITGTCVPLTWDDDTQIIETYLISNPKYTPPEWMFPGGHAFNKIDSPFPEKVAEDRTREEAGLDVSIINFSHKEEDKGYGICVKTLNPHFTYVFKLDGRVKCSKEKLHKYHYDCVYIGEITNTNQGAVNLAHRSLKLSIPIKIKSKQEMRDFIDKKLRENSESTISTNIDYVTTMLYNAFVKYKEYKEINAVQ